MVMTRFAVVVGATEYVRQGSGIGRVNAAALLIATVILPQLSAADDVGLLSLTFNFLAEQAFR